MIHHRIAQWQMEQNHNNGEHFLEVSSSVKGVLWLCGSVHLFGLVSVQYGHLLLLPPNN